MTLMTQDDTRALTVISGSRAIDFPNRIYEEAVFMRWTGANCKEIAFKLKISHGTVRNWFGTRGKLVKFLEAFKARQRPQLEESKEAIQDRIRKESLAAFDRTANRAKVHEHNLLGQRADEKLMEIGGFKNEAINGPVLDFNKRGESIKKWGEFWLQELRHTFKDDKLHLLVEDDSGRAFDSNPGIRLTEETAQRMTETLKEHTEVYRRWCEEERRSDSCTPPQIP